MRKEVRREMKEITHIKKAQNTRVSASPRLRIDKLDRYRPQGRNPNRHTQRGLGLLGQAISRDGYVAPMTAVADGEIIDGSARLEVVAEKLPNEVIVIEHDGTRPIVAKRMDIPNAQTEMAKRISIGANRIGQVDLDWDPDILKELSAEVDLGQFWNEAELKDLFEDIDGFGDGKETPEPQINKADELQKKWKVRHGDVFVIPSNSGQTEEFGVCSKCGQEVVFGKDGL